MTNTFASLEMKAIKAGFESYSDVSHPDRVEFQNVNISTLTCKKGKYNGEVVEIWYNYYTGVVVYSSVYSQFKDESPKFIIN